MPACRLLGAERCSVWHQEEAAELGVPALGAELGRFADTVCGQWHNCIQELGRAVSKQLGLPGSGHCSSIPSPVACCRAADHWMHPSAEQLQGNKC